MVFKYNEFDLSSLGEVTVKWNRDYEGGEAPQRCRVTVAGVRQSSHRSKTARGDLMMFLTLEDLEGLLDVILFPDVLRQARPALNNPAPLLVTGTMEMDTARSEPLLRAEKILSVG